MKIFCIIWKIISTINIIYGNKDDHDDDDDYNVSYRQAIRIQ